jgi:hypothetical protein
MMCIDEVHLPDFSNGGGAIVGDRQFAAHPA